MAAQEHSNFFKVILTHILEMRSLELPRKFVKENYELMSNVVHLKVPTGEESKMELKKSNGRAWLHKGWQSFVDKYSIECGYFLVFKYQGRSRFNVIIFNRTTIEIKYPVNELIQVKEEDDDDDDEILDEFPLKGRKSRKLHMDKESSKLYIPEHPASSYFRKMGNNRISIFNEDGRDWSMKCNVGNPPLYRVKLHSGWSKFVQENRLQEGDVCAFDLMDDASMTFKVSISRGNADKDEPVAAVSRNKRPAIESVGSFQCKSGK
ncbi:hypothetical protein V2J09_022667 [Rumex salicifolius]